jgi:polyhydroxyalkanoate synthase
MATTRQLLKKSQARISPVLANIRDRFLRGQILSLAGQSPYSLIHHDGLVSIRHYEALSDDHIILDGQTIPVQKKRHTTPLVIVPPLAVNMLIYDLFPTRSFVKYFLAQGFDVYLLDWGVPHFRHTHYNLNTYISELMPTLLQEIRTHAGQQELSLHGWSLGGIMALCYAGLGIDKHIKNIIILGTPIDAHRSGTAGRVYQFVSRQAEWVRKHTGFRVHNVNPRFLHTPGWMNTLGFKMTNPIGSVMGYWALVRKFDDRDFVQEHATNAAFLDNMVAYTGGIVQDMLVRIWIDNDLADGEMPIGANTAKLRDISANLLVFAGKRDTMVTPAAVEPLMEKVSSQDKAFHTIPGGHMGILAGSKAPATAWKTTAEWLAARS